MRILILVLLLALTTHAMSQNIAVWGYGATVSCGGWLADRKEGGIREQIGKHWILGFLSGQAFNSKVSVLYGSEPEGIFAEIDKYCRENPRKYVTQAAIVVFKKISDEHN